MTFLDRIERKTRWLVIPNITLPIILLQSVAWLLIHARPDLAEKMSLNQAMLFAGEWWRLVTFILLPPPHGPLFIVFAFLILYMMGTTLEREWGAFRYNLFLLLGYVLTASVVFMTADGSVDDEFLLSAVFLAFAFLFPNVEFRLYFLFPVAVKWLAIANLVWLIDRFSEGTNADKFAVVAALLTWLIFFGRETVARISGRRQSMLKNMDRIASRDAAVNRCIICGVTEKTNPKMEFRYCPQCSGTPCYCMTHMVGHSHITAIK